jgi:Ni/Co efflux regulator RcnB
MADHPVCMFTVRKFDMKKLFAAARIACLSAGAFAKSHEAERHLRLERKEHRERVDEARERDARNEREARAAREEHKRQEEIARHDAAPGNAHVEFHHDDANGLHVTH